MNGRLWMLSTVTMQMRFTSAELCGKVRYIRLLVTRPTQSTGGRDTRIYELEVYK